jgi:hypothetical protein
VREKERDEFRCFLEKYVQERDAPNSWEEDVLAYMSYWLENHTGSITKSGQEIASSNSLNAMISHLGMGFELWYHRTGNWNENEKKGNPARSEVEYQKRGHKNFLFKKERVSEGAVADVKVEEIDELLKKLQGMSSKEIALKARDGATISVLADTSFAAK